MHAKLIEIKLLEIEKRETQTRVKQERFAYRGELIALETSTQLHQLDPRYLDGLSSKFGPTDSSSVSHGVDQNEDEDNGSSFEEASVVCQARSSPGVADALGNSID